MAEDTNVMAQNKTRADAGGSGKDGQAPPQTNRREVGLHIDESKLTTSYTNGFRSNVTAEEVVLDFGMNLTQPVQQPGEAGGATGGPRLANITFQVNHRLVMNHYTAKRLAMLLSNVVRQHEEQFGELKLNATDRQAAAPQR